MKNSAKENNKKKKTTEEKVVKEEKKNVSKKKEEEPKEKLQKKVNSKKEDKSLVILNKLEENRNTIVAFIIGFLIATLLFRCIFWPDRIATLKDGTQPIVKIKGKTIVADDLYDNMKKHYSVSLLLNEVDNEILTKIYPLTEEIKNDVKKTAEYYYSIYEQNYNYTKEKFLSEYGFSSEKEFLDNLTLDYRRNKYYEDYALKSITDKEIEDYYKKDVFGDVDSKHILVSIKKDDEKDGLNAEEAKKLAEEIIDKLNKGTSWDDIIKEYDKKIIHEDLGYQPFNASLEQAYLNECKDLKVKTYSKTPVLTSYGYHIVYKKAQKDKPELKDVKDDIKELLAKQLKDNDKNLQYKSLIKMREDAKLEFVDSKFAEEYDKYINQYK